MSNVSVTLITLLILSRNSWGVTKNSWWSVCKKSATLRAYFKSGDPSNPIENVRNCFSFGKYFRTNPAIKLPNSIPINSTYNNLILDYII